MSLQTSVSALLLMLDLWRRKQGEEQLWVADRWCSTIRRMAYEIARAQGEYVLQGIVVSDMCVPQVHKQVCFSGMIGVPLLPATFEGALCGGMKSLRSRR